MQALSIYTPDFQYIRALWPPLRSSLPGWPLYRGYRGGSRTKLSQ